MANIQSCFKRYEKKYCLTLAQQQAILQEMQPYMKKDAYGQYTICNLYYDTDDWRLIRTSLEKPLYKEKLRVRSYGTPAPDGNVFVEIKKKYDGVVYKRRITARADEADFLVSGFCPAGRAAAGIQRLRPAAGEGTEQAVRPLLPGRPLPQCRHRRFRHRPVHRPQHRRGPQRQHPRPPGGWTDRICGGAEVEYAKGSLCEGAVAEGD